jgi:histidyl-tRNA synthetase
MHEVDLVQLFDASLTELGLSEFTIQINNRKILTGIAEICGEKERIVEMTVAIDKLDKIGEEGVVNELKMKDFSDSSIQKLTPLFGLSGTNQEKIDLLRNYLLNSEIGQEGLNELEFVLNKTKIVGLQNAKLDVEVTLARGLNYYTGAIFEVKADGVKMGSICGGGRYDDLTGLFGMNGMSGVGISFGADRIYDVLNELNLFPEEITKGTEVMFVNFGEKETDFVLPLIKNLRENGVSCEIYPSHVKMQKQMKYANDKGIQFVVVVGESEINAGKVQVKNMTTGEQNDVAVAELSNYF